MTEKGIQNDTNTIERIVLLRSPPPSHWNSASATGVLPDTCAFKAGFLLTSCVWLLSVYGPTDEICTTIVPAMNNFVDAEVSVPQG